MAQLTLYQVLEKLLDKLEEKQILDPEQRSTILDKAFDNIKEGLGYEPSGNELKDPKMLMKLTSALIATHIMEKTPGFKFNFQVLFNQPLDSEEVKLELKKMMEEFAKLDPERAKNFNQFIVDFARDVVTYFKDHSDIRPVPTPGKKDPIDEMKDSLKTLCDGEGNVIGVFQTEHTTNSSEAILTLVGLLAIASMVVPKLEEPDGPLHDMGEALNSLMRAPTLTPFNNK